MNKKAIVFGATGKTGVQICKQLQDQNIPYSVFVREESANKLENSQGTVVHGNVMNPDDIGAALKDASYTDIIISLGSKSLKANTVRSQGTANILKAFKSNSSKVTVHVISALGVGESWKQLKWHSKVLTNLILKQVMIDHGVQERFVTESDCKYHIIRPVGLKDNEATGDVHVQADGYLPSQAIQRADVAKYLVDSLVSNTYGFSSICEKK